jgi:hypothetical protein
MTHGLYARAACAAAFALAPLCAQAAPVAEFQRCDGYGAPNENGDGMTKAALGFLGIFVPEPGRGDTRMSTVAFGAAGVQACDAALANPRLLPQYTLRKANLLRARAIHRMAGDSYAAALDDLDAAEQAGRGNDALYRRSLGAGIKLFRAYALLKLGRKAEAIEAAAAAEGERPYAFGVSMGSALIALHANQDRAAFRAHALKIAAIHPRVLENLFWEASALGDFAFAAAVYPQIRLSLPRDTPGFRVVDDGNAEARQLVQRAKLDATAAFALASAGKSEEARALLANLRQELDLAAKPLPLRADGKPPKKNDQRRHDVLLMMLPDARKALDASERLLRQLAVARQGSAVELQAAMDKEPPPGASFALALLEAFVANSKDAAGELAPVIATIRDRLRQDVTRSELSLADLYEAIPEAEIAKRIPKYKFAKNFLGENTGNGFLVSRLGADRVTIDFGGNASSSAIVEEMALLRAADLARAEQKRGLLILSRRTYQRSTEVYWGGTRLRSDAQGYSAELTAAFVDPAAVPPDLAASTARILDPERIYAELAPIYVPAATSAQQTAPAPAQ